jgi:hypothetical protein
MVESRSELAARQEQAAKTSIVAYDKSKMSEAEIFAEMGRLKKKCGCEVKNLASAGAFLLSYSSASHPSLDSLSLDATKEVGADDQLEKIFSGPPPTDPGFSKQWALQDLQNKADINVAQGWSEYLSDPQGKDPNGPSVVVGVIDTGVDYNHPDLKNVMWKNPKEIAGNGIDDDGNGIVDDVYGADYTISLKGTGDPKDVHGHGTHCAGIIRGEENNGVGIAGVAAFTKQKVKIMALKGLGDNGGGSLSGLLNCLNYAIENGATITSNSWGGGTLNSHTEKIWDTVLRNNPNHLFVAAAGNDGKLISDTYKAVTCGLNEPNLLCVGSSTSSDKMSGFSNYGKKYVHVMAPGSSIYSSLPNKKYASWSGTSMACPQVSGLAALMRTMRADLTGKEIRDMIEANVQKKAVYADKVSSGGLIDVGATIKALKGKNGVTTPAPVTTPVPDTGDWNKLEKKHCWMEKYGTYTTVEAAKLACTSDPTCTAVYDQGCDAGANDIYLCGAVPNGYTSSAHSCIYEKPKVKYTKIEKKHCWSEKYGSYPTVEAAKSDCSSDTACTGVYDRDCDGEADDIYLCGAVPNGYTASGASCVYKKQA